MMIFVKTIYITIIIRLYKKKVFFFLNNRLKYLFVLIFVVFVADSHHFDRMFKMVLILTECLK